MSRKKDNRKIFQAVYKLTYVFPMDSFDNKVVRTVQSKRTIRAFSRTQALMLAKVNAPTQMVPKDYHYSQYEDQPLKLIELYEVIPINLDTLSDLVVEKSVSSV